MPRRRLARVLIVVLIAIPLLATSAWGAPRRLPGEPGPFDFLAQLWGTFVALWEAEGCSLDPHGGCVGTQGEAPIPPPSPDEGCMIDPHGGCTPGS